MTKQNHPKKQHYIPQFVLRRFVDNKGKIWVFDKQTGRHFSSNVKNAASENGFYDFDVAGEKHSIEVPLSKIEDSTAKSLKRIVEEESLANMTDEEKVAISRFLSIQMVRTRYARYQMDDLYLGLADALKERGLDPDMLEDFQTYKALTDNDKKILHVLSVIDSDEYVKYFLGRQWLLFKTSESSPLWISDNPITRQNTQKKIVEKDRKTPSLFNHNGLAVDGIEMYFPLSNNLALAIWCHSNVETIYIIDMMFKELKLNEPDKAKQIAFDQEHNDKLKYAFETGNAVKLEEETIVNQNSLQARHASRFVYSSKNDFSLVEKMISDNPAIINGPKVEFY